MPLSSVGPSLVGMPGPALGAHVDQTDPIAAAASAGATLGAVLPRRPAGLQGPGDRSTPGAPEALRAAAEEAGIDLYVHAPYIVNVATTNNRIRIPSRKLLQQHMDAAASIGAKGLIVHGGHVNKDDDPAKGFDNWRKAVEATDLKIPLLIENTAGGDNAMARYLDRIARRVGRDLDGRAASTRSASASTPATRTPAATTSSTVVDEVRAITGRIDLVHCNDSRDEFDSGADRHANFGAGHIDPEELAAVVREAGAPVVVRDAGRTRRAPRRLRLAARGARVGRPGCQLPRRRRQPSSSRTCGTRARNALPRWEIAFFSSGDSSAECRVSPSTTRIGS